MSAVGFGKVFFYEELISQLKERLICASLLADSLIDLFATASQRSSLLIDGEVTFIVIMLSS